MEESGYHTPKNNLKTSKKNPLNIQKRSPIKFKRSSSFLPLNLNFLKYNDERTKNLRASKKPINKISTKNFIQKSPKNPLQKIDNNIANKSGRNNKINEIQNNYFINLTKNIYTDESHMNKNIIRKSQKFNNNQKTKFSSKENKVINNNNINKYRRMSCNNIFSFYFNKGKNLDNKNLEKELLTINSNVKVSKSKQNNSEKISSLLKKKSFNKKEKEFMLNYLTINNKEKDRDSTPKYELEGGGIKSPGKKRKKKKNNNARLRTKSNHSKKSNKEIEKSGKSEKIVELEKKITTKNSEDNDKNNKIILHKINPNKFNMICLKPFFCCLKIN